MTLTPGVLPLYDWNEEKASTVNGEPRWWLDFITARLSLVTPLPADAAERKALLRQAMWDIYLQRRIGAREVNPTWPPVHVAPLVGASAAGSLPGGIVCLARG